MAPIQSKKEMSEEDIKRHFITPALERRWDKMQISMEAPITDGRVNIQGNKPVRENPKKADYLLYLNDNNPIAVVEAKDNKHSITAGLQQAMEYAQMMDLPFAYSSNGDGFAEHDFLTGKERIFGMEEFPTHDELVARFYAAQNGGQGISEPQQRAIEQPYYSDIKTPAPRYYQRVAINRTMDAVARGQDRILLVMATGTGKTYTAFQIVHRLLKSGMKRRVLYLADRNFLVDTSIQQDFKPLEKVTHKVNYQKEDPATTTSYQMYFSLYQQLVGEDGEEEHYRALFTEDFFDLIIVDECHRGSAKADSQWRRVLQYFKGATQIGMTATPKETTYASNIDYFGEPLYTYSLNQGIQDGFLAPFRVITPLLNIAEGWRPYKDQVDKFGNPIEDRIYNNCDFDRHIVLEDRTREVAQTVTNFLKRTDRMAKTIVFCVDEDAAERMRMELSNMNADLVKQNPDYVVRITGSDVYGKKKLSAFLSVGEKYPVIATTSMLLTTGADCKMTKLIVLDKTIGSMSEFKQIIGRGTRLRFNDGKTHFTVMDLRQVTRLFADPDWDGPIIQDPDYDPEGGNDLQGGENPPPDPPLPPLPPHQHHYKPIVAADGCRVETTLVTVAYYDADGRLLRQESITDYTKKNVMAEYASLDGFIRHWSAADKKAQIKSMFAEKGIDLEGVKKEQGMEGVDDFDFICHVAFGRKPLTRRERANNVRKQDFFGKYSGPAREVLEDLLDRYADVGVYELEDMNVLKLEPFCRRGAVAQIIGAFGGRDNYLSAVRELERAIYSSQAVNL